MSEDRIRMDLKKGGRVTFTKSAIVAAVRILEQDQTVELSKSSQDIANWIVAHIRANYVPCEQGDLVTAKVTWVEDPSFSMFKSTNDVQDSTFQLVVSDKIILIAPLNLLSGLMISEALPRILAEMIKKTPCVNVKITNIDDFI